MRLRGPRQALAAVVVGLLAWTVLDSSALYHEAEASPLGVRRTVALAVLAPVALVARFTRLDWPVDALDRALGRDPSEPPPAGLSGRVVARRSGATSIRVAAPTRTEPPVSAAAIPSPTAPAPGPLRILVIGDSLGSEMGDGLAELLGGMSDVEVDVDARPSTGLSRPDYFDWPARLQADLEADHPGLVMVMVGGNDAQAFLVDGRPVAFDSAAWNEAYRSRVRTIVQDVAAARSRLLWIGVPICASPGFSADMAHLDSIYRAVVGETVDAYYFDTWALFSTPTGAYSAYLTGPGGQPELVRQSDGIHLSIDGVQRLDVALDASLRDRGWLPAPSVSG